MKSITEFANFVLSNGLKSKAALEAEGKSPEEVQQALGTSLKYEGDKLKHFINALEVAVQNPTNLKRVLVVSLGENETPPPKASKVEETHYVPEFLLDAKAVAQSADHKGKNNRGGGKGGGKRRDSEKSSPWGLSPEQKAAKNAPKNPKAPAAKA